eukprot:7146405-Pyramimonas_sp.AAC.1
MDQWDESARGIFYTSINDLAREYLVVLAQHEGVVAHHLRTPDQSREAVENIPGLGSSRARRWGIYPGWGPVGRGGGEYTRAGDQSCEAVGNIPGLGTSRAR